MILVKCTKIPGKSTHSLATCEGRKALKGVTKYGGADPLLELCLTCDPEAEMKLVEFEAGGFTPPVLQKKCKKVAEKPVKQESRKKEKKMVKKIEYVCTTCKEKTDDPGKFVREKGICRKCYMKEYHQNRPKKSGSTLAPRMSRQEEDIVDVILKGGAKIGSRREILKGTGLEKTIKDTEVVTPKGKVLDTPVKDLTLRDVVEAGGEVRIVEKRKSVKDNKEVVGLHALATCKVCGIIRTEAETFNMGRLICGECEKKAVIPTAEELVFKPTPPVEPLDNRVVTKPKFSPSPILLVDFSGHPDLLDFLKEMATEEFRTAGGQLLSLVNISMCQKKGKDEKD